MMSSQKRLLVTHVNHFLGTPVVKILAQRTNNFRIFAHDVTFDNDSCKDKFLSKLGLKDISNIEPISGRSVEELAKHVDNKVDVLINNDAYAAIRNPIEEINREEFVKALEELTVFPFELTTKLIKSMQEKKHGKIIFITSATPFRGLPNYSSYTIARGATNTMALTFAQELAKYNIQVNAVAPNFIESPTYFPKHLLEDPETYKKIVKPIPLRRLGKPEEPAELIAFLASDKADYITGQVIPFAGGWC